MKQSFTPVRVGRYRLPNRLVMAPMTRSRAKFDGTPGELAAEYYGQRASVGLIVTEGTQPSDDGQGYLATPGIYSPAHIVFGGAAQGYTDYPALEAATAA
jgi:N-ethylmaleimide reductase